MSENDVVRACLDILTAHKIFAWRQNSGAFETKTGGFYRISTPGIPDIIAVYKGKFLGIECKMPGKKQSASQVEFQRKLEKAGGTYLLIDNPDLLIKYLK